MLHCQLHPVPAFQKLQHLLQLELKIVICAYGNSQLLTQVCPGSPDSVAVVAYDFGQIM